MRKVIVIAVLVVVLGALFTQAGLAAFSVSTTQTITQEIVTEPAKIRDPNQFDVFVRLGYDSTWYFPNDALIGCIEAAGEYNGTQHMLYVPAGCIIEGEPERINWLWLDSINDGILTFALEGDATFSEPCTLYTAEGGRLYQDYWTGDWLGEGEWVEVGTFTEIVNGEAILE